MSIKPRLTDYVELVGEATKGNDHTGAVRYLIMYAASKHNRLEGVDKLMKAIDAVATLHNFYGYLTPELKTMREGVHNAAVTLLSIEESKAFALAM